MFLYSTKSSQLSFMERYHKETLAKARARTFPYYRYPLCVQVNQKIEQRA